MYPPMPILKILVFSKKKGNIFIAYIMYNPVFYICNKELRLPVFHIIKRISLSRMAGGHFSRILLIIWNIK